MLQTKINQRISLNISRSLWQRIIDYFGCLYGGVIPTDYPIQNFTREWILSSKLQLDRLKSLDMKDEAVCLDAGCGVGTFVAVANLAGYNFYGYDLDKGALSIARGLLKSNGISPDKVNYSTGSFIKSKRKFDLITSFEVVEHLADMQDYFKKLRQLIKAEGKIFIETPNYLLPYEPHFYVFLPPFLPKSLSWNICKMYGRTNRYYFNELNFVNNYSLGSTFRKTGFSYANLGQKEWIEEIMGKSTNVRSNFIKQLSRICQMCRLTDIVKLMTKVGIYTPLVYIVKPIQVEK